MTAKYGVYMWGYVPAGSKQSATRLQPTPVISTGLDDPLKSVCNGGCGFAIAISESGKLNTWGSTPNPQGQFDLISEKEQICPGPLPLQLDAAVVQAAAGWAHCAAVAGDGEVYTWGWRDCLPNLNLMDDGSKLPDCKSSSSTIPLGSAGGLLTSGKPAGRSGHLNSTCKSSSNEGKLESFKRRKVDSSEDGGSPEHSIDADGNEVYAPPRLVNLGLGIRIVSVAAGGRHTLALSDGGSVWGWGYGGEGQLGLGSRIQIVSSPQRISCFSKPPENGVLSGRVIPGSHINAIACGGRHSAVVTDTGDLFTFGWGLYGQVGHGGTEDELNPSPVAAMGGLCVVGVAAGLWHTLCITDLGDVYAFGGNQFGQLGIGGSRAELCPRLVDAAILEDKTVVAVACGARHSIALTETGSVFSWGWNKYGQLGLGDSQNRDLPMQVTMDEDVCTSGIACGWWHTLATVHMKGIQCSSKHSLAAT